MSNVFLLDSTVRFTKERLSVLTPRDRQGLEGRIGVVQTDGNRVQKPTVYFPSEGAKPDLRLFGVDPRHLELVEGPPASQNATQLEDAVKSDSTVNAEPAAPSGGERLSQSDMDNLFD